jgi:hypothetical protein
MFFITEFCKATTLPWVDLHCPQAGEAVFDANVNVDISAANEGTIRDITFLQQQPHSTAAPSEGVRAYATLHFQGAAKQHMIRHLRAPSGPLPDWCLPALTQCLSQLREQHFLLEQCLNEARTASASAEIQHRQQSKVHEKRVAQQAEKEKAVSKILLKTIQSRWLRLGRFLRASRASEQLESAMDKLKTPAPLD